MSNKTFEEQVAEARLAGKSANKSKLMTVAGAIDRVLSKEAEATVEAVIKQVAENIGMDDKSLTRKLAYTWQSPYGRLPALVLLLANTYSWPISGTHSASEIPELQEQILDTIIQAGIEGIDHDLLTEIKISKGRTSYLDRAIYETVPFEEPNYDRLQLALLDFGDKAQLPVAVTLELTPEKFQRAEAIAVERIKAEIKADTEAKERHDAMLNMATQKEA